MKRQKSSAGLRVFRGICSFVMTASVFAILIGGFNMITGAAIALAVVSIAAPIVIGGGSFIEMVVAVFGAILEGILTLVEGIVNAVSGMFN